MEPESVDPQIEVEAINGKLRITVPKTVRVTNFYNREVVLRSAAMIVVICFFIAIGITHLHDVGWDIMWSTFVVFFGGALYYALRYPDRVSLYSPSTAIISFDDSTLSVLQNDRHRRYAKDEISTIRAQRFDFSHCGKIVVSGRRDGRRFRSIIAVYPELQPLAEAAERLRQEIGLLEKR